MFKNFKNKKSKFLSYILYAFLVSLFFVSCSQDDDTILPNSVESKEKPSGERSATKKKYKFPTIAVHSVTPCGYGFKVKFYYLGTGAMATGVTKPYQIFNSSGTLVDSSTVTHNGNTNWVLNPCEVYTVQIDAGPFTGIVTFTVTSDGCGGTFIC